MKGLRVFEVTAARPVLGNRPDDSGEFAGNGDHDLVAVQAASGEAAETSAQAQLRFPGDIQDRLGHRGLASGDDRGDRGAVLIGPGGLDQSAARRGVACLGDRPLVAALGRGVLLSLTLNCNSPALFSRSASPRTNSSR